ncbi:MAG: hypothetical protein IJB27_02095 [Clostridia bacterium]|nr:hypothetical protein [Clostridia bacterium]
MSERQYVLQHLLHLSAMLAETTDEKQKRNIEDALLFYARELRRLDQKTPPSYTH